MSERKEITIAKLKNKNDFFLKFPHKKLSLIFFVSLSKRQLYGY